MRQEQYSDGGDHGWRDTRDAYEPAATNGAGNQHGTDALRGLEPGSAFALFGLMAKQTEAAERVSVSFQQQRQALLRGAAEDPLVLAAIWRLEEAEKDAAAIARGMKRGLAEFCPGPRVSAFIDGTQGLGQSCFYFLGLLPQWVADFETVSKLWAYCGLHVVDGKAPRREKGKKANWSARLKSIAIKYMAEPCMKNRGSPYRGTYELRRAHTAETHPDWPDWRSHKDALRITAKAIAKDLWRVSRGHDPLFGGATAHSPPPSPSPKPAGQQDISRETTVSSPPLVESNPGTQTNGATHRRPSPFGTTKPRSDNGRDLEDSDTRAVCEATDPASGATFLPPTPPAAPKPRTSTNGGDQSPLATRYEDEAAEEGH